MQFLTDFTLMSAQRTKVDNSMQVITEVYVDIQTPARRKTGSSHFDQPILNTVSAPDNFS